MKHTVPAPGTVVSAGDVIEVSATWDTADWTSINKVGDCLFIERPGTGVVSGPVSVGFLAPVPNTGTWDGPSYTVPTFSYQQGDEVCDRIGLSGNPTGQSLATQKSTTVCFPVQLESTTTTAATTTTTTGATTTTTGATTTTTAATTTTTGATTTTTGATTTTTGATTTTTTTTTSSSDTTVAPTSTSLSSPPTTGGSAPILGNSTPVSVESLTSEVSDAVAPQANGALASKAATAPADVGGERLARTGFNARLLVLVGLFLIALGGGAAGLSRIGLASH